jgi:hypothetical protein
MKARKEEICVLLNPYTHHLLLFTENPAMIETTHTDMLATKVCVILPVSFFIHSLYLIFAVSNATDATEVLHNQA